GVTTHGFRGRPRGGLAWVSPGHLTCRGLAPLIKGSISLSCARARRIFSGKRLSRNSTLRRSPSTFTTFSHARGAKKPAACGELAHDAQRSPTGAASALPLSSTLMHLSHRCPAVRIPSAIVHCSRLHRRGS